MWTLKYTWGSLRRVSNAELLMFLASRYYRMMNLPPSIDISYLDDIRFYNIGLSQSQIIDLMMSNDTFVTASTTSTTTTPSN